MRDVARPVRMEPERVERVDFVLRAERVEGVRPEPVRVEPALVALVVVCAVDVAAPAPAAAMPHVSQ
jgi:hypothetical protein